MSVFTGSWLAQWVEFRNLRKVEEELRPSPTKNILKIFFITTQMADLGIMLSVLTPLI